MAESRIIDAVATGEIIAASGTNEISTEAFDKGGTEQIIQLTEETSPGDTDVYLMERASDGQLRRVPHSSVGGASAQPFTFYLGGDAYTGTGIIKLQLPFAITATSVVLGAGTAPTGSSLTYDLNYHATDPDSSTTIFSVNPSITATNHTGSSSSFSTSSLAKNGWIVIDCDAIGSTLPGSDVTISIRQD
jgi:hypothetical protein